ncbi:MAG TPA: hypothetical protein VGG69_00565 [Rhizomicrobium sp.]|jgi:hypothetical protein
MADDLNNLPVHLIDSADIEIPRLAESAFGNDPASREIACRRALARRLIAGEIVINLCR